MEKIQSSISRFVRRALLKCTKFVSHEEAYAPPIAELLERRMMLTFTASMSAPQSVSALSTYNVNLSTSGGVAAKWIVNWGDGGSLQTFNAPTGGFGVQFQAGPHTYSLPGPVAITATAYTAANVTAVAAMTLASNFGSENFQGSGKTTFTPVGSSGDSKGQAMAVDHFSQSAYNGDIYVASNYNDGVNGQQMAITRFNSQGNIDYSWGAQGTFLIQRFSTGADTPAAIDIALVPDPINNMPKDTVLAIAGRSSSAGWAVAMISVGDSIHSIAPTILWQNTTSARSAISTSRAPRPA